MVKHTSFELHFNKINERTKKNGKNYDYFTNKMQ